MSQVLGERHDSHHQQHSPAQTLGSTPHPSDRTRVVDPVCGMQVDPASARGGNVHHHGHDVYFCSERCRSRFLAEPSRYPLQASILAKDFATQLRESHESANAQPGLVVASQHYVCPMDPEVRSDVPGDCPRCGMALEPETPVAADKFEYVCPMHPEVLRDEPGSCPICGMALEPRSVTQHEAPNPELTDMRRRFWISVALTLPLFLLGMSEMLPASQLLNVLSTPATAWIELGLATPVVLWGGWSFLRRGVASVMQRRLNMFTLVAIGTTAAYGYSTFATLAPQWLPHSIHHGGRVPLYFEAAAVITTLVLLGQVLELRARGITSSAVRSLLGLSPKTARRIGADGSESEVLLSQLQVGDRLRIRPGEKVPADGELLSGTTHVDESMITGEPVAVLKSPGLRVTGGTLNGTGGFVMRVDRIGQDTLLAQIVRMVGDAQRTRAPIQRLADRVSAWFVPSVVVIAILTSFVWGWFGPAPQFSNALVNAIAVLIIACPCALGLATPMSIMVGTGRGASEGILIRSAEALETLEKVDTLVFDKTGTLTEGKPQLVSVYPYNTDTLSLVRIAAALEQGSEHPLAAAVLAGAQKRAIAIHAALDFVSVTGKGVSGTVDDHPSALGSAAWFIELGIDLQPLQSEAAALSERGETPIFVATDGRLVGILGVADPVKPTSRDAIAQLKQLGVRTVMLTGDARTTALAVASQLGIDHVEAEVLPNQKRDVIAQLQRDGAVVAMAGDGINDAPALALAQVGIAMGTGTDIAMQSAGVTLVKGDLRGIIKARQLSRAVMRNIRQNLFFAFVYNVLGVAIAAGLLYPVFGLLLNPMLASAAMSLSSVSVIANALRLRRATLTT